MAPGVPIRQDSLVAASIAIIVLLIFPIGPGQSSSTSAAFRGAPSRFLAFSNMTSENVSGVASINATTFAAPDIAPSNPLPPVSSVGNWPTYGQNAQRTDTAANEHTLAPGNASSLATVWSVPYKAKAVIEGSMAAVNDTLYFGDYHGNVTALNATSGAVRWSIQPGGKYSNVSWTSCFTAPPEYNVRGITGTPTVWNNTVYIPGGNGSLFAINASTHSILWSVNLVNQTRNHDNWTSFYIWGSPLIYKGFLYIGTASGCDNPLVQGEVKQINIIQNRTYPTIAVRHVFTVVQNNSTATDDGGSVWSTPSVDPSTGSIYITTGNEGIPSSPPVPGTSWNWTQAVVRLVQGNLCSPTTLQGCSSSGYFKLAGSKTEDVDFGAGATIFHDDHGVTMVGALNKNGSFYAFYQSNLTPSGNGKPAWQLKVANSGAPAGENVAPAAFDGSSLYIAGYSTILPGNVNCSSGAIRSVNATTDSLNWGACLPGFVHAGVTYANGLVLVAALWKNSTKAWNTTFEVFNASTGALLFTRVLNGTIDGEPIVWDGRIFLSVGNFYTLCANGTASKPCAPGYVYALGIPLGSTSTTLRPYDTSALGGNIYGFGNVTGGLAGYNFTWTWGDSTPTSYGRDASHVYYGTGSYLATVQITDAAGATSNSSWAVTNSIYNCNSGFGFCWATSAVPCWSTLNCFPHPHTILPITLAAYAKGGIGGVTWNWNFGDGSLPSSAQYPVHTYSEAGTYTVTVTATDQDRHQATKQFQVTA